MKAKNSEEFDKMTKAFFDIFELWYVGGYPRSFFTNEVCNDIDLATDASPDQMIKLCNDNNIPFRTTKNGVVHGTVVINEFEITTFRKEIAWEGHNCTVQFAKTIEEDLSRRDFTCNAIAINVQTGDLLDPFDGREDIKKKIIKAVGNPRERLREDTLRAIRAIRFANQLDFHIESKLQEAIFECDISNINPERLTSREPKHEGELIKIFKTKSVKYMNIMWEKIIPEMKAMRIDGGNKHKETVYDHSLFSLDYMLDISDNPLDMLCALLHDIGKPSTANDPERKFKNHEDVGAEIAKVIMERLKFPTDNIKYVTTMIKEHMRWHWRSENPSTKALRRAINVIGEENIESMLKLTWCDTKANKAKSNIPDFDLQTNSVWIQYQKMIEKDCAMKISDLAINGNDLIELGLKPGVLFSEILEDCLDKVSDEIIPNDKQTLLFYVCVREKINSVGEKRNAYK